MHHILSGAAELSKTKHLGSVKGARVQHDALLKFSSELRGQWLDLATWLQPCVH